MLSENRGGWKRGCRKEYEWTREGKPKTADVGSRGDVDCTLQQNMYVSTWQSAFDRMKLGGTAEE